MQTAALITAQLGEIATGISAIMPIIEKGGVTAFLVGIVWYQWRQGEKRNRELLGVYKQRDAYREAFNNAKGKIDLLKLKLGESVDLNVEDPKIDEIPA